MRSAWFAVAIACCTGTASAESNGTGPVDVRRCTGHSDSPSWCRGSVGERRRAKSPRRAKPLNKPAARDAGKGGNDAG